ncbi:hypothetical protein [Cellulomonas fimi]|uniref:Uncharacterized protein n=1 Tax=Cellulomonas fimi (strain ATCC 484 / DSM 20113 / JCM 1341 / CCUG 24087 / LMG 16345 / NBRC 15513 / NCIMB 8980 / NCTC 7547 / NRS-133) TaxID=590998 RepID=F4H5W0_CELFA|nr:hypothetical protein [Cellulomonas fimi]AEE45560.1 hypothetical protein Celf_1425 [Cellulomonas fimi ATCC 484]NNH05929.1 hypothetical protein [Cellulomonas fimi]VEH29861.1 Uncharacterised protein [Cellulomonas fimi]
MTRLTLGNVVKVTAVLVFLPLIAYLVLVIGAVRKHVGAALEGLLYAAGFSVAVFVLDGAWGPRVLLALAAMGVSAVRAWHRRDLWLPARRRWWKRDLTGSAVVVERNRAQAVVAVEAAQPLPAAVARIRTLAERNRRRLPGDTHRTVLRTCEVLDAVIAAEQREPAGDARFEYELDAVVRQYLPAVLTGYLAIAPSRVQERQPDGRTPDEELTEQLRILAGQADALYASRHRLLTAELSTTGNFLRDKYAHHELDVPDLRIP